MPASAFIVASMLFLALPGHPDAWFSGVPVGSWALALLAVGGFAWVQPRSERPRFGWATLAMAILVVAKCAVTMIAPTTGWLGRYYANGDFAGLPRQSTAFVRLAGATRIDPAIDFQDDYLPLYFLNDADFNRGTRREVSEPISVDWTGHLQADAMPMPLSAETRGDLRVTVDAVPALEATTGHPGRRELTFSPGDHVVGVRYHKPANTDPLVRLQAPPRS